MNTEYLRQLLSMKEKPNLEFKLRYVLSGQGKSKIRDEVAKDLVSLANSAGRSVNDYAYLIVGAADELKLDGTRDREDVRQYNFSRRTFLDIVNGACDPQFSDLIYEEVTLDGNCYGVITISPSPYLHKLIRDIDTPKGLWRKNNILIRRGDGVGVASQEEIEQIKKEKDRATAQHGLTEDCKWVGVTWKNAFLAYEGPIEELEQIEDRSFETSIKDALETGGFNLRFSKLDRLTSRLDRGYRIIHLTNQWTWRQRIVSGQQVLLAIPKET